MSLDVALRARCACVGRAFGCTVEGWQWVSCMPRAPLRRAFPLSGAAAAETSC